MRVGGQIVLTGAALLVKLGFERDYSEHTTDLLCATVEQEESLLRLLAEPRVRLISHLDKSRLHRIWYQPSAVQIDPLKVRYCRQRDKAFMEALSRCLS